MKFYGSILNRKKPGKLVGSKLRISNRSLWTRNFGSVRRSAKWTAMFVLSTYLTEVKRSKALVFYNKYRGSPTLVECAEVYDDLTWVSRGLDRDLAAD
jgi:hypothetical protein